VLPCGAINLIKYFNNMAIGVSPCPPFCNRAGLPPGVLWDGNTAAWYKHNDAKTIFYDGGNRVHAWLDRMNYAVGADFINGWNFTVGWAVGGGAVIVDNNTFTTAALGEHINTIAYNWILNTYYRLRLRLRVTAGVTFEIRDQNAANTYFSIVGSGAYVNYDIIIRVLAIGVNGIRLRMSAAGQADIEYWYMEPIAGNHLYQATLANQPILSAANGLLFDGTNDFLATLAFVLVRPEFIYFVGRQITWTNNDKLFDGLGVAGLGSMSQTGASPNIAISAGVSSPQDGNLALNTFGIVRALFNGAGSSLQVNLNAAWNGNTGVNNMGGFVLGANGVLGQPSNIQAKEIIIRRTVDNAAVQQQIYNYLRAANGL